MAQKTIYLDFDGVLHPNILQKGQAFCHMPALAKALTGKSVGIIVSSSWRLHETWEYIENLFPPSIRGCLVGRTGGSHLGPWSRWNEIIEHAGRSANSGFDSCFDFLKIVMYMRSLDR